jgi:hypothetical protein
MAKKKPAAKPKRRKPAPRMDVEGFGPLILCRPSYFWAGVCSLPTLGEKFGRLLGGTAAERAQLGWKGMPAGSFPVEVMDERRAGPSAPQLAALRLLASSGEKISKEVIRTHARAQKDALKRWAESYLGGPKLDPSRFKPSCCGIQVLQLHWKGTAYAAFRFRDDGIDDEHGSEVVYHPAAGTHWTSNPHETITEADPEEVAEPEPTLGDRLAEAALSARSDAVKRLQAQGADINDLSPGAYPPLYYAVANAKVELVKRLLELGADPNKRGGEKRSVLSEANEALRDFRWAVKQGFATRGVANEIARYEEIVRLLKEAGAR